MKFKKSLLIAVKLILVVSALIAPINAVTSTIVSTPNTTIKKMKIAVYLLKTYDIDFSNNTYKALFWVYVHHKLNYNPIKNLEIVNAIKDTRQYMGRHTYDNGEYTDYARITAVIKQKLSLRHYPFDKHQLNIHFEDSEHMKNKLVFMPYYPKLEPITEVIDPSAAPENWDITNAQQKISTYTYNTNFGDVDRENISPFSRYTFSIHIKRSGYRQFFIMMIFLYLAALLAILTQFIDSETSTTQTRNSLLLASVFCLTSNHIATARFIKDSAEFILLDQLQILTLLVVLISFAIDRVAYKMQDSTKQKIGVALSLSYIILNTLLILHHTGS